MRPDHVLLAPFYSGCTRRLPFNCTPKRRCNGSCLVQNILQNTTSLYLGNPSSILLERFVESVIERMNMNKSKNFRTGVIREYTHVCHKDFNESLHDCFAGFIDVCLNSPSKSPSPCINLLYNHCLNRTKDCREAVENEIEEIIEEECDKDYDDCVSLCIS